MPRRSGASRRSVAFLVALVVGGALGGSVLGRGAPAALVPAARCVAHGSRTVLSSRLVRVYRVEHRFYGCLRSSGRVSLLASPSAVEPQAFDRRALNGTWVAWTDVETLDGEPGSSIQALDLRTHHRRDAVLGGGVVIPPALAISRHGALAWLRSDLAPSYVAGLDATSIAVLPPGGRQRSAQLAVVARDAHDVAGVWVSKGRPDGAFSHAVRVARLPNLTTIEPHGLAAADIDGDGITDLVAATATGAAVLPGRANGTFGTPVQIRAQKPRETGTPEQLGLDSDPVSVVVGDLDRDGHPDIVGSPGTETIWVARGLGGFAFAAPRHYAVSTIDGPLAIDDVDGDSIPDVVAEAFPLAILHGNGDGTLSHARTLPTAKTATDDLAVADLNHDAIPDLVYLNLGDGVSVQRGHGDGSFAPPVRYAGHLPLAAFALADMNNDGTPDIVGLYERRNHIPDTIVLAGRGDGTFAVPRSARASISGHTALALGDVTGDGRPDVVTPSAGGGVLVLGNHNGTFAHPTPAYDLEASGPRSRQHELVHAAKIDRHTLAFHGDTLRWRIDRNRASARVR